MIFGRHKHKVPELNTTSTADISFMLLIFFLVTTNMDVDKGLTRQLPPAEKQEQQDSYVSEGTLLTLSMTADGRLFVDGHPTPVSKLQDKVEAFISRVGKKHLIKLAVDPDASYDAYFHLQNALVDAYRHQRDLTSRRLYGLSYSRLSDKQRDVVRERVPQRIAEDYSMQKVAAPAVADNAGKEKGGQP